MDDGRQLDDLIRELKNSTSRLDQLKKVTRAWRVIKGLTPRQRLDVAAHLGIEEGLPLLESMGKSGGLSPATLAQAVAKAEHAHPGELQEILARLGKSGHRMEVVRQGLHWVEAALPETEEAAAASLPPPAEENPPPPAASSKPVPPIPLTPPTQPPEPVAPRVEAQIEVPTPKPPVVETPRAEPAKPELSETKPAAPKPPVRPPEPDLRWAAPPQPLREPEPAPGPEAGPPKSLTARFRSLNRRLGTGPLPDGKLEAVLADFPEGWPRRRALTAVIRSGAVGDLGLLLDQITRLDRPTDEYWCLSTLVHAHDLSPTELEEAKRRVRGTSSQRLLRRLLKEAQSAPEK